jgi:DNA-binding transcriptional ArsR family regulator
MPHRDKVIGLDGCAVKAIDRKRVAATRSRLLPFDEAVRLAALFRLLGDPTRARILFSLLEAGELCVCDLAATVDVPETSVSHALRLLRASGVVRARRDGRMIHYSLADAHVRLLLDVSYEHLRHGEAVPGASDVPGHRTGSASGSPRSRRHSRAGARGR